MNAIISIIMPCKNGASTLSVAIDSVLSQDYSNFELLIIDDGSQDESCNIINAYSQIDPRVIFLINRNAGKGVWSARNVGLNYAKGRYICFLDCDDYLLPQSLSTRLSAIEVSGAKVVHGAYLRLYSGGKFFHQKARKEVDYTDMLTKNHIGNLVGMYDSKVLGIMLQENFKHEDYLMWCRLIKNAGKSHSCGSRPLAVYRVSNASLSGNKFKAFTWRWKVLRYGLSINILTACWYQFVSQVKALIDRIFSKEWNDNGF
jgi:teichuronic acid biosynthesis glycosyltransferase TuaG